jgi:predicted DNA-binding transcriptional regulator AlpA
MLSRAERDRRARQRKASQDMPRELRVRDLPEMIETSGLSRWTITRAAAKGELKLIMLTSRAVGARESEFWRWIDDKEG